MIDLEYLTAEFIGIHQCASLKTADIPFSDDVRRACEANACGRYGKCWTCPPGAGTVEELRNKLLRYENAIVFTHKGELLDSFDIEGMESAGKEDDKLLRTVSADLSMKGIPHIALGRGSCKICESCTYPESPCRHPDTAIVSVEACGINVVGLSAGCNINYHNGANTVTYFNLIIY